MHEAELASGTTDDVEHDYYIQLASHLIKRNWNQSRREREQRSKQQRFGRTNDRLEQGWYYEGTIRIPNEADRTEAERLLADMVRRLRAIGERSDGQERQLGKALKLQNEL